MTNLFQNISNIGVKPNYFPWEIIVTKRLNIISFLAFSNIIISILFFIYFDFYNLLFECLFALLAFPIILILNYYKNYLWAAYFYLISNILFFIPINLKLGIESFVILYYFPIIIAIMFFIIRKDNLKHVIIFSVITFISFLIIGYGLNHSILKINLSKEIIQNLTLFNIFVSLSSTIAIIYFIINDFITQENTIKIALKEKTILLAEVNHRVKNNLSIINGLLNIKIKNAVNKDVKFAIEESKNRIYSMALIHQYIIEGSNIIDLNFQEYIEKLVLEIKKTCSDQLKVKLLFDIEKMEIGINNALPLGLIINELITNSFKYANKKEEELEIKIKFKTNNNKIELEVRDNGNGIKNEILDSENTMGIELIKTLSEQINGEFSFENDSGLVFRLKFS